MKKFIFLAFGLSLALWASADIPTPCLEKDALSLELEHLLQAHPEFKTLKKEIDGESMELVVEGLPGDELPDVFRNTYSLGAGNIYELRELFGQLFNSVELYALLVNQLPCEAKVSALHWLVEEGFDVNEAMVSNPFSKSMHVLDDFIFYRARDETFMRALLALGAVCKDPLFRLEWVEDDLDAYASNPLQLVEKRYHYLNDRPSGDELKIPPIMHHIWLTHPDSPREILIDFNADPSRNTCEKAFVVENAAILAQSKDSWQHIVWVNNPALIPESVKRLNEAGIEIRCIEDYAALIENYKLIQALISHKLWGMASDALRFSLIFHFGGVYADLNFELFHDLSKELRTYDAIMLVENNELFHNAFLAAKPNHPVFALLVLLIARNFKEMDLGALAANGRDFIESSTIDLTSDPLTTAYYKCAQMLGNRDVVFPMSGGEEREIQDNFFEFDYDFVKEHPALDAACPSSAKKYAIMEALNTLDISMDSAYLLGKDHYCDSWLE